MEFLNLKEAAKILKMKPGTLRGLFLSGKFHSGKKIGKNWKIYKDDLLQDYRNFENSDSTKGKNLWQSTKEKAVRTGGLDLPHQMVSEYENRLGLKTNKQQRN